jgi:hypothetical protein
MASTTSPPAYSNAGTEGGITGSEGGTMWSTAAATPAEYLRVLQRLPHKAHVESWDVVAGQEGYMQVTLD